MTPQFCECGRELKPARAFWDGEPTYVGFVPCPCDRPMQTDHGTIYPGDPEHTARMNSGRYSINDLLSPIKKP
jgi:hypothetical protein